MIIRPQEAGLIGEIMPLLHTHNDLSKIIERVEVDLSDEEAIKFEPIINQLKYELCYSTSNDQLINCRRQIEHFVHDVVQCRRVDKSKIIKTLL